MERLVPITKKQHDHLAALNATHVRDLEAAQQSHDRLAAAANAILAGLDDDPKDATLKGVTVKNGVHSMVLDVPEPAKDTTKKRGAK